MIFGIGTDLASSTRIANLYKEFGERFLARIYTENELLVMNRMQLESRKINFLAKRYAAKEAFAKALKTGIGKHISFLDIEVKNGPNGDPFINLSERAKKYLTKICGELFRCHLSLCDEGEIVSAFVVIEKFKIGEELSE